MLILTVSHKHNIQYFSIKRFLSSTIYSIPIIPNFLANIGLEVAHIVQYSPLTRLFICRAVYWTSSQDSDISSHEESKHYWLRAAFGNLMILLLRLVAVRNVGSTNKNDKLMKINFLNKLRIINETASSKEYLASWSFLICFKSLYSLERLR